jgi:uncharacterized membrane-anchored protein YhcB (DUF1043 family)
MTMETLWTLISWFGSGFAFAGGFFVGIFLMAIATRDKKKQEKLSEETTVLMRERNELDKRKATALEQIAKSPWRG